MRLFTNMIRFHDEFGIRKMIDIYAAAGYDGIDFNADLEEYYTDAHDEDFYRDIRKYAGDKGLVFGQAHAPFASSFADEERTKQRFGEIVRGMRHAALAGAEQIVVHPCAHKRAHAPEKQEYMTEVNLAFYRALAPYAKDLGIRIAIENICGAVTKSPEGLRSLLGELNDPVFTGCLDVGHMLLCGYDPADAVRKLKGCIGCTHIHDNDGKGDMHTLPFYGQIDWRSLMRAFGESGYSGDLSYEAGYFVSTVPPELRPAAAAYMAETGRCLIGWYEENRLR